MASTPQSRKAKGRRLQQDVCKQLYETIGVHLGLQEEDFRSCSMGANGVDVILSPAAKQKIGDWAIECKNKESLNVTSTFEDHKESYPKSLPLLVHKRNRIDPLVTLDLSLFLSILANALGVKNAK